MQGTVSQKIGRLVGNLITQPRYLPRYVNHNLRSGVSPVALELPWFSYAAIDFLETYLQPHMKVCEYGTGGSTLFFAQRVKYVFAIEDKPYWFNVLNQRMLTRRIHNVRVLLRPFDFKNPIDFHRSEYLWAIPQERFDVIVVDGSEEWHQVRPICFQHAENFIKPGGIIVVDDSWRYHQIREGHSARHMEVFKSVGPCRPGVTSTDVFFY